MWEQKRNIGGVILRIAVFLVVIALLAGFFFYYKITKDRNEAQDAAYLEQYQKQTEQQVSEEISATAKANVDVQAEYEKDLAAVEQYLPGIVCWGDMITGGSAAGASYPQTLKDLIDLNICDKYDFRSTIDHADNLTKIRWEDYHVDIPVVNMGVGEENSYTILGRAGVLPYTVSKEVTIPAECTPVDVSFVSQTILEDNNESRNVKPLIYGDGGVNPVTIGGIQGTLTADPAYYSSSHNHGHYTFTRLQPGEETVISEGEPVITSGTDLYKDYIHVILIGTYGTFDNAAELVEQEKALIARQTKNSDRYIVLGMYGTPENQFISTSLQNQVEALMSQTFGNRFINLRKYLSGDAISDAEITPTKHDQEYIKDGKVPPSLRSSEHSIELSGKAYELVGKVIYDRMEDLGYFDEVKDELGISAIEKAERQAAAAAKLTK